MNEGFRDIGRLGANLELPEHVTTDAARYLEAAKDERLPGGRMAWESLAAGAVLLAGRASGVERTPARSPSSQRAVVSGCVRPHGRSGCRHPWTRRWFATERSTGS
ncbi:hypothetical protein [Haloarcula mannanilytica]|nr:hypothetical protein [Haloarcula mannanilytica]